MGLRWNSGGTPVGLRWNSDGTATRHKMAQALRDYVSRHKGDVWNAPRWVFAPTVTLPIGKAAAFLGVSAIKLIRNTDLWGFTVYRTSGYWGNGREAAIRRHKE